jgi:hypothetical protein
MLKGCATPASVLRPVAIPHSRWRCRVCRQHVRKLCSTSPSYVCCVATAASTTFPACTSSRTAEACGLVSVIRGCSTLFFYKGIDRGKTVTCHTDSVALYRTLCCCRRVSCFMVHGRPICSRRIVTYRREAEELRTQVFMDLSNFCKLTDGRQRLCLLLNK